MKVNFATSLDLVLEHEGGYVDHPKDPGGATNRGITTRVYDAYRLRRGLPVRSVASITMGEVSDIYLNQYWNALRGDDLPIGIDYAVFDFGVNSGVRRSAQFLQRIVGVVDDGIIGEITLDAVGKTDPGNLINNLCGKRMDFLRGLSTWSTFSKGWIRRVDGVRAGALEMIRTSTDETKPEPDVAVPDGWEMRRMMVEVSE